MNKILKTNAIFAPCTMQMHKIKGMCTWLSQKNKNSDLLKLFSNKL